MTINREHLISYEDDEFAAVDVLGHARLSLEEIKLAYPKEGKHGFNFAGPFGHLVGARTLAGYSEDLPNCFAAVRYPNSEIYLLSYGFEVDSVIEDFARVIGFESKVPPQEFVAARNPEREEVVTLYKLAKRRSIDTSVPLKDLLRGSWSSMLSKMEKILGGKFYDQ